MPEVLEHSDDGNGPPAVTNRNARPKYPLATRVGKDDHEIYCKMDGVAIGRKAGFVKKA